MDPIRLAGRHGKWVLVGGLLAAVLLPRLGEWLSDRLVVLIFAIMFLGALRLRPEEMRAAIAHPRPYLVAALALQLAAPMAVAAMALFFGVAEEVWARALVLTFAAAPIVSSPNIAAMLKQDGTTAMGQMIWATLIVPFTSILPLIFVFGGGSTGAVLISALTLAGIILVAGGSGALTRLSLFRNPPPATIERLDGLSAIALAIFVMALMPALQDTYRAAPTALAFWIVFTFAANFAAQIGTYMVLKPRLPTGAAGSLALSAGNRNMALFFAALAPEQTAPFLPFLAAYQIPMYLTPMLLDRLYRR